MDFHDLALVFSAFVSEILGTLSGFGSSTFFVPIALQFESFQLVLALTALLHCFGNLFKMFLFRKDFLWAHFFQLAIPSVLMTGVGALMTVTFNTDLMTQILGAFLILFSIYSLFIKKRALLLPKWLAIFFSALSGFLTGFVGTGGALRGLALSAMQLPKNSFVALSSSIDIGGDFLRAFIYVKNGFMDWNQWYYLPLLALAAFAGASLGKKILNKINQNLFEKIVAIFILLSGISMFF